MHKVLRDLRDTRDPGTRSSFALQVARALRDLMYISLEQPLSHGARPPFRARGEERRSRGAAHGDRSPVDNAGSQGSVGYEPWVASESRC